MRRPMSRFSMPSPAPTASGKPGFRAIAWGGALGLSHRRGGPVLGICNGFQVLLEAGLLPGAMLRNRGLKFQCKPVHIRVESTRTPFTRITDCP